LDIVLIIVFGILIAALTIVLILETIEHRKAIVLSKSLHIAVDAYAEAFSSMVEAVKFQNEGYIAATNDHAEIGRNLEQLWGIIEVHNKTLNLSPKLTNRDQSETP